MKSQNWRFFLSYGVCLFCLIFIAGCSASGTKTEKEQTETTNDAKKTDFSIVKTDRIQKIIDRGYLTVGVKTDVPGFGYYNEDTKTFEGGEVDLACYLAAKIFDVSFDEAKEKGLVHFQGVTTAQRETVLTEDQVDYVIATYTITKERKKVVEFSDSYYKDAIGMMIRKEVKDNKSLGNASIRSAADLDGKRVGIIVNSTTRKDFLDYIDKNDISITPLFMEYSSYQDLSQALDKKEIDAFCVDVSILNGYKNKNREILPGRFASQKYGVAAKKGAADLIDIVNVVLKELEYRGICILS